jgi:transmembrane 9 superfamily protein 3
MVSFRMRSVLLSLGVLAVVSTVQRADAGEDTHVYKQGEDVTLWLNKIGPYHNPQETYTYYTLPFCKPQGEFHKQVKYAGIGEVLEGTELVHSAMHMKFGVNTPKTPICNQVLTEDNAQTFRYAVSQVSLLHGYIL